MSVSTSPPMFLQFFVPGTNIPLVGGKLFTYIAGTATKQATWTDYTQGVQNTNPIILDSSGIATVWLDPTLTYKFVLANANDTDPPTSPIKSADGIQASITSASLTALLTQALIGSILYPQSAAEVLASVTPVNLYYNYGIVDRYATNTTPGTTNMSPAITASIAQSLQGGAAVRFLGGAYSVSTAISFGGSSTNVLPIDIGGVGYGTQVICNLTASSGPLWPLDTYNGWYLHDMLICGNSAHKNDGIHCGNVSSTLAIYWRIENVLALMAGVGIKCQNTNTGVIFNFQSWPGNNPTLIVPQTVTTSDISHHIYGTGSFFHNVSIENAWVMPNASFASGQRGIKIDASSSYGVNIITPLVESGSGANTETGIDINVSSGVEGLNITGAYCEGTIISLGSISQSTFSAITDGGAGGTLLLNAAVRECTFQGINLAVLNISDSTAWGNSFKGVGIRTTFTDATEGNNLSAQPNTFEGCALPGAGSGVPFLGSTWRKLLAYSASIASDVYAASCNVIRATSTGAFTIVAPLHPRNGQIVLFTVRNESGGSVAVTWSGFGSPPWTNPANGQNRTAAYMYDSDFQEWRQLWYSGADVPN